MTGNPPVEIERKFLAAALPDLQSLTAVEVRQGYLTSETDTVEIRLRQKGQASFMTLKSGSGLLRTEYEIPLDPSQFDTFWPATEGRRIEKTRYLGALDGHTVFELDVFHGTLAPLIVVEVEFTSVAAARDFTPPAWFGDDVTEDARFKNKALATAGNPLAPG
ncbi:MAG: CYTH domain-containing protein [Paracoccaceae bacterium]